jgi:Glycosyl hydrolases family 28
MDDQNSRTLTRRKWLGAVSTPAMAAALLPLRSTAAEHTAASPQDLGARVYNIRSFGAKGDGKTLDTAALQAAIDACTRDGGGTVLVPSGTFVIGTTELKSNVTLHLAASATLLGSGDGKDYHAVSAIPLSGDSTLGDGNWALLFAVEARNITVEGSGTIDGQGQLFNNSAQKDKPPPAGIAGAQRPYHLLFHRCHNIAVRDIELLRCAFHSIRVIQSERARMEGLYIHNRVNSNNDGFHFISAKYVNVSNCVLLVQDDACALFGSCQFVTVTNCVFSTRWSVFRFGGGDVKNIAVSNCIIYETYGCPIKIGAGRMTLENLSFSNLILQDVTGPIGVNFSGRNRNEDGGAEPAPWAFVRNLSFSNIRASVVAEPTMSWKDMVPGVHPFPGEQHSCITLNGIGDVWIENVTFDDVHVTYAGGGTAELAAKRNIPQTSREYFGVWGEEPFGPPAYGLFARNVKGLTLHNVRFTVASPDLRPAIVLDNVQDAAIHALSVQGNPAAESVLRFTGVKDALLSAPRVLTPAAAFLQLEGAANANVIVDGGDLSKTTSTVALKAGATRAAVKVRA